MKYDFSSLSPPEFEDLVRDLLGRDLRIRFEAFSQGPDLGMDGRHAKADGCVILQAKHFKDSGFSKLNTAMKKERLKIDRLRPARYLLATSIRLTPMNKANLAAAIGPSLLGPGDIYGSDDINALLREHPDIEEVHFRLWLQSTAVMKKIVADAVADALSKVHASYGRQSVGSQRNQFDGSVRFDGARLCEAMEAVGGSNDTLISSGVDPDDISRARSGAELAYERAMAICSRLGLRPDDYLSPEESIVLIPNADDSGVITGESLAPRGNYTNGASFAFKASLTFKASTDGDLVTFECKLFRERHVVIYPPGKVIDDYTPEAWAALPTQSVRDYARNKRPAPLSSTTRPGPMMVIDGLENALRGDLITLERPFGLEVGRAVIASYTRLCSPMMPDEAPADYIYRASIECKIGFLASNKSYISTHTWVLDYSEGGRISLRPGAVQ